MQGGLDQRGRLDLHQTSKIIFKRKLSRNIYLEVFEVIDDHSSKVLQFCLVLR